MSRRADGEGSIFPNKRKGGYSGYITIGKSPDGKQIKRWRYGKTKKEVARKLSSIRKFASTRIIKEPFNYTVKEWLDHFYELRAPGRRPRTRQSHIYYNNKIIKYLGSKKLDHLARHHIQTFYKALYEEGLGNWVRSKIHHHLNSAMKEAMAHDLLFKNPVQGVEIPKSKEEKKLKAWEPEQVIHFLETAKDDRFYAFFYLRFTTGLRIGETLALTWSKVDWDKKLILIDRNLSIADENLNYKPTMGPTKNDRSDRTIFISDDLIEVLLQHKNRQIKERIKAGRRWKENDLVFASTTGTAMYVNNLFRRHYQPLVKKAKLPYIMLYDHRHTHITMARDAGVDAEMAAYRAGQDPRVTMHIYSQPTIARQKRSVKSLSELTNTTLETTLNKEKQ